MDRSSHRRVCKAEEALSIAKKQHEERRKKERELFVSYARLHATAVAAIALSGQPKIDEPLIRAWTRALQHYGVQSLVGHGIYLDYASRLDKQIRAAQELVPKILGYAEISEGLTKIFRNAPIWLLHFTKTHVVDVRFVRFDLRPTSFISKWGSAGYEESLDWPLLPLGTMMDGDPLSDEEARRWPLPLRIKKETGTIPECEHNVSGKYEGNDSEDLDLIRLLMEVWENPEKEKGLTRYQRLRMRRILGTTDD
jgi:hypothetical protein